MNGKLRIGSLFSGVGGLDMAVEAFFDAETVWHCEWDDEPSKVLAARWPGVPNHRDVTTVDWASVEPVDILCGGFPCQDLSLAGRRSGMRPGTRSGLWADFVKAIDVLRPSVVVIENVRGLLSGCAESNCDLEPCPGCVGDGEHRPVLRALGRVLGDLADLGFDAEWGGLRAADVGAPHGRYRVFVLAYAKGFRLERGWPAWGGWAGSSDGRGGRAVAPVTLLPTPTVTNQNGNEYNGRGELLLPGIVRLLPTPVTTDAKGARNETAGRRAGSSHHSGSTLTDAITLLPTPQVADATGGHASRSGDRSGELLLPGLARAVSDQWVADDGTDYGPAVRLWESLTRPAPAPTLPDGKNGNHRLAAVFPEWMMGYPAGWVTDIIGRNPAIKACGNGVVPQQAFAALGSLWARALEGVAA